MKQLAPRIRGKKRKEAVDAVERAAGFSEQ